MNRERNNIFVPNDNHNDLHNLNPPPQDEGVMSDVDIEMSDNDSDCDSHKLSATKRLGTSVSDQALHTLNELRHNNLLCDAIISVPDDSFNIHRAILSTCSSYFR